MALWIEQVRFPVELRPPRGFSPDDPSSWPRVDGRLEFVGGRLLYLPPCGDIPQDVVPSVAAALLDWARGIGGFVVGSNEAGMKLGPDVRGADVAVWRRDAVGKRTGGYRRSAPLLAVEVVGQDEDEETLGDKAQWYLRHGTRVVWIVVPNQREVVVVTATGTSRFASADVLPEHPALPGLAPPVARFFEQLDD